MHLACEECSKTTQTSLSFPFSFLFTRTLINFVCFFFFSSFHTLHVVPFLFICLYKYSVFFSLLSCLVSCPLPRHAFLRLARRSRRKWRDRETERDPGLETRTKISTESWFPCVFTGGTIKDFSWSEQNTFEFPTALYNSRVKGLRTLQNLVGIFSLTLRKKREGGKRKNEGKGN